MSSLQASCLRSFYTYFERMFTVKSSVFNLRAVKSSVFNLRANLNVIVIMCRYDSTFCYNEYRFEQRYPYYVCRFVRIIFNNVLFITQMLVHSVFRCTSAMIIKP